MNQNSGINVPYLRDTSRALNDAMPVSQIILDLQKKYATNAMVIAMLSAIAEKILVVPIGVQDTVVELLKANLESKTINTGLITAAIIAINPQRTITENRVSGFPPVAVNDERYAKAA